MIKITSMAELKNWIDHPTEEKPFVMDWFMKWFFKQLIARDRVEKAKRAMGTIILFTMICEKMEQEEATELVISNLRVFASMESEEWRRKLHSLLKI